MGKVEPLFPEIDFGQIESEFDNLHAVLAELVEAGHRVVPVRYLDDIAWLILRYEDLAEVWADDDRLPAADMYRRFAEPSQGRVLLTLHGEEHRWRRALGSPPFTPSAVRQKSTDLIVPLANELIDKFQGRGEAELNTEFAQPYPFHIISRMLGFPKRDEQYVYDLVMMLFRFQWDPEESIQAKADFDAYTKGILDERRQEPREDVISYLARAEVEGGRPLEDIEIFDYVRMFYPAGAETTFRTITNLFYRVLSDESLRDHLIARPEDRKTVVEEVLRLDSGLGLLPRYTEKPITIAGVDIPGNSRLFFGIPAANREPGLFEDPDELSLDPERARPSLGRKGQHLAFGRGVHFCLGSHLAREEMRVGLSLILDRLVNVRLADPEKSRITGTILRGCYHLPVTFDEIRPPIEAP
ncbi:cytochrome P450 [Sphingosinicella terrae]|uniref:cytochrome P450 n=1 Tax=Sphingosinicella terrae TaxID=2172047 RepID=UPI000E0DDF8A|nr:cytochrome P450 [Sphingosinicella terrae]